MKILNKKTFAFILLFLPSLAFASNVLIESSKSSFDLGEEITVGVFLDTKGKSINAIEGNVKFDKNALDIKRIEDGGSTINFWIKAPDATDSGQISFSGITPGGFSGEKVFLFSAVFVANKSGTGIIKSEGFRLLQSDGLGTENAAKAGVLQFSISNKAVKDVSVDEEEDTTPPEDFLPIISNDSSIFDGQNFVVFSAQDKGSGIDYFEVKEGFFGKFILAQSPYLLQNQKLDKKIYVKAIDKSHNEKVAVVYGTNYSSAYQYSLIISIIFIAVMALLFSKKLSKKRWRKSIK